MGRPWNRSHAALALAFGLPFLIVPRTTAAACSFVPPANDNFGTIVAASPVGAIGHWTDTSETQAVSSLTRR